MSDIVRIKCWAEVYTVERFIESEIEFTREEWDSMTPEQRDAEANRAAADLLANYAGYGYDIEPISDDAA